MKVLISALLSLAITSPLFAQPEDSFTLSLKDTLNRVCSCNLSILQQRDLADVANYDAKIKRADLLPQVNITATQSRSRSVANFGTAPFPFHNSRFDTDVESTMTIVDFGKFFDYYSAKTAHSVAELNTHATVQSSLQSAAQAFFLHHRNLRKLDVINANLKRSETLLELADLSFRAGTASPLDVTRAKVQLAVDEKAQLQQKTEIRNSELQLKQILDIPTYFCLDITLPNEDIRPAPGIHCCNYDFALQHRPDYRAALMLKEQYLYDRRSASFERFPTVNASVKWGGASMHTFDGDMLQEWAIGANLSMPVFDGFRIRSKKLRASSLIRSQEAAIRQIENSIASDLAFNQQDLTSRYLQITLSEKQVNLGKEELDYARTRFQAGVADNSDIVIAQANLAKFSDDYIEALYNYDLARIQWASSLGNIFLLLQTNDPLDLHCQDS